MNHFYRLFWCLGFVFFSLILSACHKSSSSSLSFVECLEKREEISLATWIQAISQQSLDSLGNNPIQIIQIETLKEVIIEEDTIFSYQEGSLIKLGFVHGKSHESDKLGASSLNALKIQEGEQVNLNASSDDTGTLYITNIFSRDPIYQDLSKAATHYLWNVLCLDRFEIIETYPDYFPVTLEERENEIHLTWTCRDPQELSKILSPRFSKLGVGFSEFEEHLICNKQGVLLSAQWKDTQTSQALIMVKNYLDSSSLESYIDELFNTSKNIGDPLSTDIFIN